MRVLLKERSDASRIQMTRCNGRKAMTEFAAREPREVEVVTPEQEKLLDRMSKFLDTLTETLGEGHEDPEPEKDKASPRGAARRVARTILEAESAK